MLVDVVAVVVLVGVIVVELVVVDVEMIPAAADESMSAANRKVRNIRDQSSCLAVPCGTPECESKLFRRIRCETVEPIQNLFTSGKHLRERASPCFALRQGCNADARQSCEAPPR